MAASVEVANKELKGSFWILILYDVAEEIEMETLRKMVGGVPAAREPSFRHPAPGYVRFETPPIVELPEPITLTSGDEFQARIKYFDYGVVCVELEMGFSCDWSDLIRLSSRWIEAGEVELRATELVRRRLKAVEPALIQPYGSWLSEDYYVIHIAEALGTDGKLLSAADLLLQRRQQIAQLIRGESVPLSESEQKDALDASLSYYPNDLLVVGWVAALVYDNPKNAEPTIQLLEYANTQLLQYRHYDEVLTRELKAVYDRLEERGAFFRRWMLARKAEHLNAMRLDVIELTERSDNAIKFLSDMFYARAYRAASNRVGVSDYRRLVEEKLRTAGELYDFMVNEFHQARAFVLEAMVVAILIIELVDLFRGR